jgi:Ser/Thr protein kinase RdoA (MazF antagonist)
MNVPDTLLSTLFYQYSDEKIITHTQLPKTTSGNDAYVITTKTGQYVLRTLARQEAVDVVQEHRLQVALQKAGIATPLYIKTASKTLTASKDGITCTLSRYIIGSRPESITFALVNDMGATLGRIQNAIAGTEIAPNKMQWFNPINVEEQFSSYEGPQKQEIAQLIKSSSNILGRPLPRTLIHGDLHIHNIFAHNEKVSVVFDLETVAYGLRILDIARTYLTLVKGSTLEPLSIMQVLIEGYNHTASIPLSNDERAALADAIVYVASTTALYIYNNGNITSSMLYVKLANEYANPTTRPKMTTL